MTLDEIFRQVSIDTGIDRHIVEKTYKAYWTFIKQSIEALPLKQDLTEEEFNKLKPHFTVPYLGKLCCTYKRFKGVKKRLEYIKKLHENSEKNKASVQQGGDNNECL